MRRAVAVLSTSSLDFYPNEHDIKILPMHVYVQGNEFLDVAEISNEHFIQYLSENPSAEISTSPPRLKEILSFLNTLIDEGYDEVIMITISSEISQSLEFIEQVATKYAPSIKVTLFDSVRAGFSESVFAFTASRLVKTGLPTSKIILALKGMLKRNCLYFSIDEPKRLSSHILARPIIKLSNEIFQLKPILYFNDSGKVDLKTRAISIDKALDTICLETKKFIKDEPHILFTHISGIDEIDEIFFTKIKKHFGQEEPVTLPVSPLLISHLGIGACAVGAFLK